MRSSQERVHWRWQRWRIALRLRSCSWRLRWQQVNWNKSKYLAPPPFPSGEKKVEPGSLLEHLNDQIKWMKKKLECPVCFKVAAAPLFCCPRQHLICSECRPQVRLFLITIESSILMFCPRCRSALCAETQPSQSDSGSWRRLRRNWRKWDRREFRSCPEIVLSSWVGDACHAYITHRCQKNQLCDCASPLAIICFCESFKWIP